MRQKRTVALIAGAVALSPGHAFANMGVPMIGLFLPPAWCLLLPIIVLEAAVGRWKWQIPLKAAPRSCHGVDFVRFTRLFGRLPDFRRDLALLGGPVSALCVPHPGKGY